MHTTKQIRVLGEMKLVFEFHHTSRSFTVSPIQEMSFTYVSDPTLQDDGIGGDKDAR